MGTRVMMSVCGTHICKYVKVLPASFHSREPIEGHVGSGERHSARSKLLTRNAVETISASALATYSLQISLHSEIGRACMTCLNRLALFGHKLFVPSGVLTSWPKRVRCACCRLRQCVRVSSHCKHHCCFQYSL